MTALAILTAMAFNLACTGTEKSNSVLEGEQLKPFVQTYRIDLSSKTYCIDDCQMVGPIAEVRPEKLIISASDVDTWSERSWNSVVIDRTNGAYFAAWSYSKPGDRRSIMTSQTNGQCEVATFSGFPEVKTKF